MTMARIGGFGDVLYDSGGWTVCSMGHVVFVNVRVSVGSGPWDSSKCPYKLPAGLRPPSTHFAALTTQNGGVDNGRADCRPRRHHKRVEPGVVWLWEPEDRLDLLRRDAVTEQED